MSDIQDFNNAVLWKYKCTCTYWNSNCHCMKMDQHWSSYKNQHICECFTLQYKYERHKSPQACNFPSENNSCRQLIQLWPASPLIRWISFGHDIIRMAHTLQEHIGAQRKLKTILDALCVADWINLSFLNLSQAFIVVRLWTCNTGNGN